MDIITLPILQLLAIRSSIQGAIASGTMNAEYPSDYPKPITILDIADHWLSISGVEVKLPRDNDAKALEAYEAELTKLGVL